MELFALVYFIGVFWALIHFIHRLALRSSGEGRSGVLPSIANARGTRRRWLDSNGFRVTLRPVYLRLETTSLNDFHDACITYFTKKSDRLSRKAIGIFYDIGSVAGVFGMVIAISLLFVTTYKSSLSFLHQPRTTLSFSSHTALGKRDSSFEGVITESRRAETDVPLQIILPGVTVPLSHLPVLLFSLLFSQIFHELGHAITAALESVPVSFIGVSLSVLIPSAFVALPTTPVRALTPFARLRIMSSGAFHNLILYFTLLSISRLGIGHFVLSSIGFEDISNYGRFVVGVDELLRSILSHAFQTSPLRDFLGVGSVITDLDDHSLGSVDITLDPWTEYLSRSQHQQDLGWCIDKAWFLGHSQECCASSNQTSSDGMCFTAEDFSTTSTVLQRCVPPLAILQPDAPSPKRCVESMDCGHGSLCVQQPQNVQLLRITFRLPVELQHHDGQSAIKVVVWSGPGEELLEEVKVSRYAPHWQYLSTLPDIIALVFNYITTLTLSLYFFNLIPLPYLDGSQLLEAVLDYVQQAYSSHWGGFMDLESGYPSTRFQQTGEARILWQHRILRSAHVLCGGLVVMSLCLGAVNAIR